LAWPIPKRRCSSTGLLIESLISLAIGLGQSADGRAGPAGESLRFVLHSSEVLSLAKALASSDSPGDSYPAVSKLALDARQPDANHLLAFEENRSFVYAVGSSGAAVEDNHGPAQDLRMVRRLVVLKPSILVVDDEVVHQGADSQTGPSGAPAVEWHLYSQRIPKLTGQTARVTEGRQQLSCETLLPRSIMQRIATQSSGGSEPEHYLVQTISQAKSHGTRFLHLFHVVLSGSEDSAIRSELTSEQGTWRLNISTGQRVFRLSLPPPSESAGEIAISAANGKMLLSSRPLPSGVLPHGPEGIRLMELWDADYRGKRPPAWDIGRPADELQKLVNEGALRSCHRVVDLGCGSGTDAIYLAGKGLDVTAIDIAPTALSQAQQKARKMGISVRWLLADVLVPPHLEPFDFIYDRGCYHVVRDQNLAAYIEMIRRFSHPGSRFLLLAARQNGQPAGNDRSGVTEEELRYDFLPLFEFERLREIRLESNQPGVGPPGWSALLRRTIVP
jgi:methyl halide transferase